MSSNLPAAADDDNPEWTDEDFARAKRGDDIPLHIQAAFGKRGRGRPAGSVTSNKQQVTLRIDRDTLEHFKASGAGWQSWINRELDGLATVGPDVLKNGWAVVRRFATPGSNQVKLVAEFATETEADAYIAQLRRQHAA